MTRPLIVSDCPASLLKAYPDKRWANALIEQGLVRMRRPSAFQTIEDARSDKGEGRSYLLVPGDVPFVTMNRMTGEVITSGTARGNFNFQSTFINPTYIFCSAGYKVDMQRLGSTFGAFVVEITQPHIFLERLNTAITSVVVCEREWSFIDAFPVRYTRGEVAAMPEDHGDALRLNYGQKSSAFSWETEFRVAAVLSGPQADSPEFIDVSLGSLSDIATYRF